MGVRTERDGVSHWPPPYPLLGHSGLFWAIFGHFFWPKEYTDRRLPVTLLRHSRIQMCANWLRSASPPTVFQRRNKTKSLIPTHPTMSAPPLPKTIPREPGGVAPLLGANGDATFWAFENTGGPAGPTNRSPFTLTGPVGPTNRSPFTLTGPVGPTNRSPSSAGPVGPTGRGL